MYALTIKVLDNEYELENYTLVKNIGWIYAVSYDYHLLERFIRKIQRFSSDEYLQSMEIEIVPYTHFSRTFLEHNNMHFPYYPNRIYVEGIVNAMDGYCYSIDEFTEDCWLLR